MNVLLDTCVWGGAKAELQAAGHDVLWTGDLAQDPGDEDILAQAHQEKRALITLDKDFGELAIRRSLPHCGIVRLVSISARQQGAVCQQVLAQYGDELTQGAIITVEAGRVRIDHPMSKTPSACHRTSVDQLQLTQNRTADTHACPAAPPPAAFPAWRTAA